MNIKRLDDPTIPVASTLVGLIIYGMQGGQTVKVTPTLLEGSDGVDGVNGKSAYQVAVDNGFVGTAAQWLDSLIGNSAYEEWVANGGVGTFQDFLDEIVETVNLLIPQTLTEAQKEQVRENINVLSQSVITDELAKKAEHGYAAEETPKTVKEIDDSVSQLAGDVSILDAVQGAKIRDIESIISTMNPNQSAQLSVSGASPFSLPKNAANGGMRVKLEGFTAENMVVNGDFRDGLAGWEYSYPTQPIVSNKIVTIATGTGFRYFVKNIIIKEGDKIYVRRSTKRSADIAVTVAAFDGTPTFASRNVILLSDGDSIETFTTKSVVYSSLTNTDKLGFYTYPSVSGTVEIQYLFAVNLTATFGAGNEPTKEQCDLIFSDYFEGVKSFDPTGRVRSVGKNVLDISSLKSSDFVSIGGGYFGILIPVVPNVTYAAKAYDIANLGNPDFYVQWRNEDATGIQSFASPNGFYSPSRVFPTDKMIFAISAIASNIDSRLEYIKNNIAIQIERSPTSTPYEPYKETNLYLTAPELRSNGTVKDEIRKGANGYELVKRVNDIVFSGIEDWANFGQITLTAEVYRANIIDWALINNALIQNDAGIGKNDLHVFEYKTIGSSTTTSFAFYFTSGRLYLAIDKAYLDANYAGTIEGFNQYLQEHPIKLTYVLATPEIIPISYGGVLNSAENGTVYHEPVVADAGVYGTNLPILLTDYPIASLEEIIKHENGIDTYLDVSTAVIAGDKLSFTHPSLVSGDLVLFTYAYNKESTNGNITATFYDSNVVKIDTVTGKVYRINDVVTNGVLTRTLTEV